MYSQVLSAFIYQKTARPEHGQSQSQGGSQGDHALLAGHGRGRLPGGCDHLYFQESGTAGRLSLAAQDQRPAPL